MSEPSEYRLVKSKALVETSKWYWISLLALWILSIWMVIIYG